ncbi:MAG: hypothetical protein ACP5KW_08435 [Thermoproteota archaeon]
MSSSGKEKKFPLELKDLSVLSEYIDDWSAWNEYFVIKTKGVNFHQLLYKKERIPMSLDFTWVLIGVLDSTPNKISGNELSKLFNTLKNNEVTLRWKKGFFKSAPLFVNAHSISNSAHLTEGSLKLENRLNSSPNIMNLIRELDPSALYVLLESVRLEDLSMVRNESDYFSALQKYSQNPSRILWNIAMKRLAVPWGSRILIKCIKLLDAISYELILFQNAILNES